MNNYEKLGVFYLGREYDVDAGQTLPQEVLYDTKDLTTHAVIVGMTGSGKTGLGITILEEAAIDGIPALIIDPKGDMANLKLTFPEMRASDFEPWLESSEAMRKGLTVAEYAQQKATEWKQGLESWAQPVDRVSRFQQSADVEVFTPGSDAGRQLTVLKSLDAPSPAIRDSAELLRDQVSSTVAGLLTLLGIDADPIRSREHILISNILESAWQAGRNLDLAQLIREIQNPPFKQIGVMDLESIIPVNDRRALAMSVNNLLASPAFSGWTQGERLDIQKMLYSKEGKPRLAIVSIAHLGEKERMFFVTILLNEMISWMRSQPGTSSLRAILYMDELFGYLPPTANPPSKLPLLTLLKQARAYGVGLVLSTQNPVDLDYKALSNAGTWFLGRLQTERDKTRMLDGLEGASTSAGVSFNRKRIETILSGLKNRVFLMNNVHEDQPILFQTRWALSFLRGPMTREQIRSLTGPTDSQARIASSSFGDHAAEDVDTLSSPPILPPDVKQTFYPVSRSVGRAAKIVYQPAILARSKVRYADTKLGVDLWQNNARAVLIESQSVERDPWEQSESVNLNAIQSTAAEPEARFAQVPAELQRPATYKSWTTSCKAYLFRELKLEIWNCPALKLNAVPGETEGEFRIKVAHAARERRDLELEKVRRKSETALNRLQEKVRKASQRVEVEKQQATSSTVSAAVSIGSSVLGALFGRKTASVANATRAASSVRAGSKILDQRSDIRRAQENHNAAEEELLSLEKDVEADLQKIKEQFSEEAFEIETKSLAPRKSDLTVDEISVLWLPYAQTENGGLEPAFNSELFE